MSVSRVLEAPTGTAIPHVATLATRRVTRGAAAEAAAVFSQPLAPMSTAFAVALLTLLAIKFGLSSDGVVVVWLANAVAAAMWVRTGKGLAFDFSFGGLIMIGVLTGERLSGYSTTATLILSSVQMIEIVAAVTLMRRFAPGQSLSTVRSVVALVLSGAVAAPLVGATAGSFALMTLKGVPLMEGFQMWWLGHSLGMMLIVPMIVGLNRASAKTLLNPVRVLEWVGLLGALIGVSCAHYFFAAGPVNFILNMLLVVIAARLRMAGVALAMLASAILMFASILYGPELPATAGMEPNVRILATQLTLLSVTLPFMLVAALLSERDALSERARAGQRRAELASESKSRLLANVAHEIKSPVAGVIGIGELWSSGQLGPVTPMQREMADMLVKTARQVETLAHDLLDVSRAESGSVKVELRPTDVVGVLQDVCRATALRPDAQALKVFVEEDGVGLVALADSQRLTQVIDNLATNAVKYGAAGGSVIFRALRVETGVRIEVSDLGPGLTPEKQTQLFEPFNRLGLERTTVEGHGIGLALAKRLVELQGGLIGVDSAPGEGATFWVELPAA
jgi:signal transduction histidine kinase